MNSLFSTTAQGLEELLKSELETLGPPRVKLRWVACTSRLIAGRFTARCCGVVWRRASSCPLNDFSVGSDGDLYRGVQAVALPSLFTVDKRFAVHFSGTNAAIRNSQYSALKVKDAIVDSFTRHGALRPDVDRQQPDIRIKAYLHRNRVMLSLDLSGSSLHQRGYRDAQGQAPLKENLAAAIVLRSGEQPGTSLLDPMCGSGTLLIDAALLVADCAPGLRVCFGDFPPGPGMMRRYGKRRYAKRASGVGVNAVAFLRLRCRQLGVGEGAPKRAPRRCVCSDNLPGRRGGAVGQSATGGAVRDGCEQSPLR